MSHSAGDSNKLIRTSSTLCAIALACAALAVSGCSEDLKVSNQDARIVLVGDLSEAGEVCGFTQTKSQALLGDTGATDAGPFDAGQDGGLVDAGPFDAGQDGGFSADTGGPSGDAGLVDAGEPGDDAGAPDNDEDAGSADAGSWDGDVATGGDDQDAGTSDAGTSDALPSGRAVLERDGDMLAIPYLIIDREADAQSIKVEICRVDGDSVTQCGVAVAGHGGAGASGISTTPGGQCVLHVFNWDVGCGRFTGVDGQGGKPARTSVDVEDEIIARISVVDSEEPSGQSAPFTLKALGFDALPHCE